MVDLIIVRGSFEWSQQKEQVNIEKHGVDFSMARYVFKDPQRIFFFDEMHSQFESRYFCIGRVGEVILTVRFVQRGKRIRILGAGRWRKWTRFYEKDVCKIEKK